jgi:hypothetical protein
MTTTSWQPTKWKLLSLWSGFLVCLCVAAGYFDDFTHFRFEFIEHYYNVIGVAGLIGAIVCVISLIGWAKHLGRRGRTRLALCVLLWPWAMCLIGYPIEGINPHGAAAPLLISIVPVSILSMIFFAMAAAAKRDS